MYAKYGRVAWSKTFTGQDLTSGPAALRSIAFSSTDFYTWVALALLALIAIVFIAFTYGLFNG